MCQVVPLYPVKRASEEKEERQGDLLIMSYLSSMDLLINMFTLDELIQGRKLIPVTWVIESK